MTMRPYINRESPPSPTWNNNLLYVYLIQYNIKISILININATVVPARNIF